MTARSDIPRSVPRLFVIRHGETDWSLNGRHTGRSDIPLTQRGEEQVRNVAKHLVGPGKLVDPNNIVLGLVSPRLRATRTFQLLFESTQIPNHILTEDVREWDYGDFEGLLPSQIREQYPGVTIWEHGAPNGESTMDIEKRVDDVVKKVRILHRKYFEDGVGNRDVLIVAHGHFTRIIIARWLGLPLVNGTLFSAEPVGVVSLSYSHRNLAEPALHGLNLSTSL